MLWKVGNYKCEKYLVMYLTILSLFEMFIITNLGVCLMLEILLQHMNATSFKKFRLMKDKLNFVVYSGFVCAACFISHVRTYIHYFCLTHAVYHRFLMIFRINRQLFP